MCLRHLSGVRPCEWASFFLILSIRMSSSPVYNKNFTKNLTKGNAQVFINFTKCLLQRYLLEEFLFFCGIHLLYPIHPFFFDRVHFVYSQVLLIILLSKCFVSFTMTHFHYFPGFSFHTFYEPHGIFSMPNPITLSLLYIYIVRKIAFVLFHLQQIAW